LGYDYGTAASAQLTNLVGDPVARGGPEDARRAAEAARAAFDEGPWPRMKGRERAAHLLKVADLVKQHAGELAELEARDAGHTIRMDPRRLYGDLRANGCRRIVRGRLNSNGRLY